MALHAVDDLGDALAITREFLTPFEPRRWLVLAFVALFVGGGTGLPTGQFETSGIETGPSEPSGPPPSELPLDAVGDVLPVLAAVVGAGVLLALAFGIVGAVMEFVLIESLRTGRVAVRRYWRDRWRQGLRLFGFRIVLWLPLIAASLAWVALVFLPALTGGGGPGAPFAALAVGVPVVLALGLVIGLVNSFTTVFVVPLMIQADSGVLAAWRRLWPSIRGAWKQYLAYAVVAFLLSVGAGIATSLVAGIAALVLAIPLLIVGVAVALVGSLASAAVLAVLAVLGLVFLAVVVVVWGLVQVPVVTYLRSYALLVLGDIEASFDVIPDRRAAVRD